MFDISPTEEVGDFEVKAKFMGVEMEKVQLHFQVNIPPQKNLRICELETYRCFLQSVIYYFAGKI